MVIATHEKSKMVKDILEGSRGQLSSLIFLLINLIFPNFY